MTAISTLPLNPVTSTTVDYETLLGQARGGPEEPYPVYQFGADRKTFWNNLQGEGVYDKPVTIVGDVTIHTADPDLVSTNP